MGCLHRVLGCGRSCLSLGSTGPCSTCLGEVEKSPSTNAETQRVAAKEVNGPEAAGSGSETTQPPLNGDSPV